MKLTLGRYSILLALQFSFLVADIFFNSFAHFLLPNKLELTIFLFVLQDFLILGEYLLFTFAVHSTCVYDVGASCVILKRCKLFLFTVFVYFAVSATQHSLFVYNALWTPLATWSYTQLVLSFVQRLLSCVYYYASKRTALSMSDPRYYEQNIDWIVSQLRER